MNRHKVGVKYEEKASKWLVERGLQVLEMNYRCRQGEIDIIGKHRGYLIFIEVKYRKNEDAGNPAEAVGVLKQKKICKTADYYRLCNGYTENQAVRYDVIGICGEEITWYQNAFYHQRSGKYV